jgi:small-conductance mechanosensitive channel
VRALGATLVLVVLLLATRRVHRRLHANAEARYRSRVHDVGIKSFHVLRAERLWRAFISALGTLIALFALVVGYFYLEYTLGLFPWTRGLGVGLRGMVMVPVSFLAQGALQVVPKLIFLAILAISTRYFLRVIRLFFDAVAAGNVTFQSFPAEWASPTYRLVRLLVIAFAVVVAYPYIPGSQTDAFKGVSLFVGLVFSLGSSTFIGNMIAGYSMTYRRAFREGDVVKIGNYTGAVQSIRLMVTRLLTPKGEDVVVPNSLILTGEVVNYSTLARQGQLILYTTVGIGYETPWRQVEAMLLEAATRTEFVLKEPRPFVLQTALGDFAVTYQLNVYTDAPEKMARHYARLHQNILDVFNEYGVQIMTPAYEADPEKPKVVPPSEFYTAPATRNSVREGTR